MAHSREAGPGEHESYVKIGEHHIKLDHGVLNIGSFSLNFHHPHGVAGFEEYCCKGDMGDCKKKTDVGFCGGERPISVVK